jgi:cell division protein ZapA
MPLVNVMVNGRAYTIACDDGEEDHLRALAATVDAKTREVLSSVGQVGDTRLLLMAALLIADEHHGKPDAGDHHAGDHHAGDHHASAALRAELEAQAKAAEDRAVAALEQAAARIETIAAELSAA